MMEATHMTERHLTILRTLQLHGFASVPKLSKSLLVSEMTVRRDLKRMEEAQQIKRVHGGAVPLVSAGEEPVFSIRATSSLSAKQAIARLAADLVVEGETIALDVGSTALELAKLLIEKTVTVVTPNVYAMNLLLGHPNVTVVCPGGVMRPFEGSLVGSITQEVLRRFNVDQFFMGIAGLDGSRGVTEYSIEDATVKQVIAKNAKQTIGLVDSSKFGRTTFATVGEIGMLDVLVTNGPISEEMRRTLAEHDITLIGPTETGETNNRSDDREDM